MLKSKKYTVTIFSFLILLSACQPSEADIQEALAKTHEAQPTPTTEPTPTIEPTPTLIPLSDINLEEIIFEQYDLPAGFEPSQIKEYASLIANELKLVPINSIRQKLQFNNEAKGLVDIAVFSSSEQAEQLYEGTMAYYQENITSGEWKNNPEIGNKSQYQFSEVLNFKDFYIVFIRCNAFVYIHSTEKWIGDWFNYAKRLDARLQEQVCRDN